MKSKTINKIINKKFEDWLGYILDSNVQDMVEKNTIMTGGAITSMLLNEPVNDYDFYFRDVETTKAVAEYYVSQFNQNREEDGVPAGIEVPISVKVTNDGRVHIVAKSAGVAAANSTSTYKYFELDPNTSAAGEYIESLTDVRDQLKSNFKNRFSPVFLSSNAITLTDDVQIVIRFYGDPKTIHENYDFIHCTNYWTSWDNQVVLNAESLESILTKELIYVGSKYPIASLCRIRKFLKRNWHITAGQLLKISMQISDLNLRDFDVLEEQLTGVDVAYFHEIISKLKEKDPKSLDRTYLMSLIDEIF